MNPAARRSEESARHFHQIAAEVLLGIEAVDDSHPWEWIFDADEWYEAQAVVLAERAPA